MAWCHLATSHYLSHCWPRSASPYGITRPQWFKQSKYYWPLSCWNYCRKYKEKFICIFYYFFIYWDSIGKQNHLLWKNGPVNNASKLICDYISWNIGMSHFTLVRSLSIVRAHCITVMTHGCTGISNHLPLDCLFNSWLRILSKKSNVQITRFLWRKFIGDRWISLTKGQ